MKIDLSENRNLSVKGNGGTQNENNVSVIEISVPEKYFDYNKKIVFITENGVFWDIVQDNIYYLKNNITKCEKVSFYIWLTKDEDDFRSVTKPLILNSNQNVDGEISEEQLDGIKTVLKLLDDEIIKVTEIENELKSLINDIQNKLSNGEFNGEDGLTPEIIDGIWHIGNINTGIKAEANSITSIDLINTSGLVDEYSINFSDGTNYLYYIKNGKDGEDGKDGINGENGKDGKDGEDYIITEDDYDEIAKIVEKDVKPTLENNLKASKDYTDNQVANSFVDITADETTYTYIFKRKDGTTFTIDIPLENTVQDGRYDDKTKELILVLVSGQEIKIPASGLIDDYDGVETDTIQLVVSAANKISANIKAGSILKTLLSQELQNELDAKLIESDLANYVKNTDYATSSKAGLLRPANGLFVSGTTGALLIAKASNAQIDARTDNYYPIVSSNLVYAVESVVGGHVTVTQAEYDKLVSDGTVDENTYYYIKEE